MSDVTSVSNDSAEISYILHEEDKAVSIYKKARKWVEQLAECKDWKDFWALAKIMKPLPAYTIVSINLYNPDDMFMIKVAHVGDEEDEECEDYEGEDEDTSDEE